VAAACVAHVRDATNGGAIRPLVTVFAPKRAGVESWRIWNYELVRYAGYRSEDGEVLGDPAEAEFTQKCIDLGWRPPSTRSAFDPLPILLSGPGAPLHCFELPREEVLEVPLVHPEFEWFRDLDLRWYAVPIVSNMRLEIGGIEYTAAPFNGWYMGTEIGARNLADLGRYNLLPEVAARMGILQKREASLWRDRALVELNRAVLHSFQLAGVRMVDHHTVSELHLRFEEQEAAAGRPVTGRWDWLIPPLSGATSPLWNRAYDPCEYSPNFYTQPCEMPGAAGGFECA
jgi:nitric-oxide synthase